MKKITLPKPKKIKKWKGSFRLNSPKDDGSEQDAWTKSKFKTVIHCNRRFKWWL